jgi:hypothetical protein
MREFCANFFIESVTELDYSTEISDRMAELDKLAIDIKEALWNNELDETKLDSLILASAPPQSNVNSRNVSHGMLSSSRSFSRSLTNPFIPSQGFVLDLRAASQNERAQEMTASPSKDFVKAHNAWSSAKIWICNHKPSLHQQLVTSQADMTR